MFGVRGPMHVGNTSENPKALEVLALFVVLDAALDRGPVDWQAVRDLLDRPFDDVVSGHDAFRPRGASSRA